MINDVINAITIQLFNVFGERYKIYTDNVKQGLNKPCFIVLAVNEEMQPLLSTRKIMKNAFCIHYIPKSEDKAELNNIKFMLYANMEFITCTNGDILRGMSMSSNIENDGEGDVLHLFVSYNFTVNQVEAENIYMEDLTQTRITR